MLPPPHKNIDIQKFSVIYPTSQIRGKGLIRIGTNCNIGRRRNGDTIGFFYPTQLIAVNDSSKILIGDNVNLNGVYVRSRNFIKIGNGCRIAAGTVIIDYNGHIVTRADRTTGQDKPSPIIIGDNVWIGTNAIIIKGTSIGDNCVISASSVVKGKFPPNSIIQGNPAEIIGKIDII